MSENKKDSNPKDALGVKKVPLHAVPVKPLLEVGLAMMEGGRKYGTHNYRAIGVRMSTYYNAAMRHLMAWWEGENTDPDSGVDHIIKAIACLFVVQDSIYMGNCEDDRPIQYPNGIDMEAFNKIAADLIEKYPECAKAFIHTPQLDARPNEIVPGESDPEIKIKNHQPEKESEPKFKAGDKVRIESRYNAGNDIQKVCSNYGNIGVVGKNTEPNEMIHVKLAGLVDLERMFYPDELTLIED